MGEMCIPVIIIKYDILMVRNRREPLICIKKSPI